MSECRHIVTQVDGTCIDCGGHVDLDPRVVDGSPALTLTVPEFPPAGSCRRCGRTLVRLADWSALTKRQRKPYANTHAPNAGQSLCVACQPKVAAFERKLKRSPI